MLEDGTSSTFMFRVVGVSHVLDPLLESGNVGDFHKDLTVKLPAGSGDLRMIFVIAVERDASHPHALASLTIDNVDVALAQQA